MTPTSATSATSGTRDGGPGAPDGPALFRTASATLSAHRPRREITMGTIRAPQRLAPYACALGAEVAGPQGEQATARLVLLHDPDGQESWDGALRLVAYLRVEVDAELSADPLLAEVGWSWLTDALADTAATHTALGGTVTQTTSARFGDIAGPRRTDDLELRASWTPLGVELEAHAAAFCALLASAVGLPPEGVATLDQRRG